MISETEIIKTLTCLIRGEFPNFEIEDRDIEEGFARPSFFIEITDVESSKIGEMYSDGQEIKIYFFAENRKNGYLELLKIKKVLRYLLMDNIPLVDHEEFIFGFDNINFNINKKDKVLIVEANILLVQDDDRPDDTPDLEELEFNLVFGEGRISLEGNIENSVLGEEESDFVCSIKKYKED